jgi:hypothetical protein
MIILNLFKDLYHMSLKKLNMCGAKNDYRINA